MMKSYKVYKKRSFSFTSKLDSNDLYIKSVIESIKRAQEEIRRMDRIDPIQLLKRCTI